jgi:hypothetical protein
VEVIPHCLVANSCEECEEFRIFLVFQARLAESAP